VSESRSSLAVVLHWRSYGESDKIATLLTQDYGKLTGIAKGAKRSRRRFANSLEPLARVRVHFRQRPHATLAFLESCQLLQVVNEFADPLKFAYGSYLVELVDQLTVEEHPVRELYALLEEALTVIASGPISSAFLRAYELQLLGRTGYEPQLAACHRCAVPLAQLPASFVDTSHGTFWCEACRSHTASVVPLSPALLERLCELRNLPLAAGRSQSLGPLAAEAAQLTGRLLNLHLTRPLRSLRLIHQLVGSAN
jgi:DNA repair protein RecO (recombination protein O)